MLESRLEQLIARTRGEYRKCRACGCPDRGQPPVGVRERCETVLRAFVDDGFLKVERRRQVRPSGRRLLQGPLLDKLRSPSQGRETGVPR